MSCHYQTNRNRQLPTHKCTLNASNRIELPKTEFHLLIWAFFLYLCMSFAVRVAGHQRKQRLLWAQKRIQMLVKRQHIEAMMRAKLSHRHRLMSTYQVIQQEAERRALHQKRAANQHMAMTMMSQNCGAIPWNRRRPIRIWHPRDQDKSNFSKVLAKQQAKWLRYEITM